MKPNSVPIVVLLFTVLFIGGCNQEQPNIIFVAKEVVTLSENQPIGAAGILVENGRIKEVGILDEVVGKHPQVKVDRRYQEKTILPGFIDPHVHMLLASVVYSRPFIPPWDMSTPLGEVRGVQSLDAFLKRLKEINSDHEGVDPLIVYGYHNLVHGDLNKELLDQISSTRPILVWHYSIHDFYLNSAALKWAEVDESWINEVQGVAIDSDGELTGRLFEEAPKKLLGKLSFELLGPSRVREGFKGYEKLLHHSGVTAVADLGYGIFGTRVEDFFYWREYEDQDPYLLFLVPEYRAFHKRFGDSAPQEILSMSSKPFNRDKPTVLPQVKFFVDGAFYSQTMRLSEPGYLSGQSKGASGEWATRPDELKTNMQPYWESGLSLRIHSNGDAAQSLTIDTVKSLSAAQQGKSQRVVIEHAALINESQQQQFAELGFGVSFASHYVNHMGEDYKTVIGDKISSITPIKSLMSRGVPTSLHSDAPLAPPSPLRAAAAHVLRNTRVNTVVGREQQLTKQEALKSITLHAAWAMGLESEIGSIEVGKMANFTVLDKNPLKTEVEDWSELQVESVVVQGRSFDVIPSL